MELCEWYDAWCHLPGDFKVRLLNPLAEISKFFTWLWSNVERLIAIGTGVFGFYQWWRFRDVRLHRRLQAYLDREERRLRHARSDILDLIERPGPQKNVVSAHFAIPALRRVLKRRNWDAVFRILSVERRVDGLLAQALDMIDNRIGTSRKVLEQYHAQAATAHLLRGVIASARIHTALSTNQKHDRERQALDEFRAALSVPGNTRDVQAKEYEAHQLRRLDLLGDAEEAYQELENFTSQLSGERSQALLVARAKRFRAEIHLIRNLRGQPGVMNANSLLRSDDDSSLSLFEAHDPFSPWELIEKSDTHFVAAFAAARFNAPVVKANQLSLAETGYRSVLSRTPQRQWLVGGSTRKLRLAAELGLQRVQKAYIDQDFSIEEWLLPLGTAINASNSDDAHEPSEAVASAAGKDSIESTA